MSATSFPPSSQWEKIAELPGHRQYLKYPALYQSRLMPDSIFAQSNHSWAKQHHDLPNVTFHIARHVFVAEEGLVFTADGALIEPTRTQHAPAEVERAAHALAAALQHPASVPRHKRAILCKKRGAGNYGHWLVEMLPKAFWAMRDARIADWPVAINQGTPPMRRVMLESLAAIGIGADRTIEIGPGIVYFEELLCISGLTVHSAYLSPLIMSCMDFIAAKAGRTDTPNLYAVRRPAITRDFEDEPMAAKIFANAGYSEVECAALPFLEQVAAFKSARKIAGPMGAALTNIIFCAPGTEILVFMPASAMEFFYWLIAQSRLLDYHEVRCAEAGPQLGGLPWDKALRIAPESLRGITWLIGTAKDVARQPLPILPDEVLSPEGIQSRRWQLRFSNQPDKTHRVSFQEQGRIEGYVHPNETSWSVSQGRLNLFTAKGTLSWIFSPTESADGLLCLRAACQLPGLGIHIAYLREAE